MPSAKQLEEQLKVAQGRIKRAEGAVISAARRVVHQHTQTNLGDLKNAIDLLDRLRGEERDEES